MVEIIHIGNAYGQVTRWGVYDQIGLCPALVASMGEGGGHTPMILVKDEATYNEPSRYNGFEGDS